VRVVNLFLRDSVDDQVYRALRRRCGLFEHFVGTMQPVLARARRMLLGQDAVDLAALGAAATLVEQDALARETYVENPAVPVEPPRPAVTREDLLEVFKCLDGSFGPRVRFRQGSEIVEISAPGFTKTVFAATARALERDRAARPLSPFDERVRELVERLHRPGERLPLVIGSFRQGGFRRSLAYWVEKGAAVPVESLHQLSQLVEGWRGAYPDPADWVRTEEETRRQAQADVEAMAAAALKREQEGLERQREAARLRLHRELGRYLACVGQGTADLNAVLHQQMLRDIASAARLKQCLDRLGGYPEWPPDLFQEIETFVARLTDNQRRARLLGKEIDAALEDPRWAAEL